MATHWKPTGNNPPNPGEDAHTGSVADRTREAWWVEFDGISEDEVRTRINRKVYDNQVAEFAREWLTHRDALRLQSEMRSFQSLAERAKDIATDASRLAQEARDTARAAATNASAAQEAIGTAGGQARASLVTARLAIFIAILALAGAAAEALLR